MRHSIRIFLLFSLLGALAGCGDDDGTTREDAGPLDANPIVDGSFFCWNNESAACVGNIWNTCEPDGEFLQPVREDCGDTDQTCIPNLGCRQCNPGRQFCEGNNVAVCNEDGTGFEVIDECSTEEGEVCRLAECRSLCEIAELERSYEGCEFYAADLDNAALGFGRDASSQQYSIVVSNPSNRTTDVVIEVNDALPGEELAPREVARVELLPGDLEVFELPRREVDGSSSNQICTPDEDPACPGTEVCVCAGDTPPCFCRVSEEANGLNDGTHTALTSNAYRVRSTTPIIAYQFNPLTNAGVFSNDASLLIPTSATSTSYSVVGWPQTIADGDCDPATPECREIDFNPNVEDEDLRAFLTLVGGATRSTVEIELGSEVRKVVGNAALGYPEPLGPGDTMSVVLGPFDVLNLETEALNADFTGTFIDSTSPISVFVGSEASDAPRFDTYATRRCCADHLEEQLFGNDVLGALYQIARMPRRTAALNDSFEDPFLDSVAEVDEPEWVKVLATFPGVTTIVTTLPAPNDRIPLRQGESVLLRADQDFMISALDGRPISVLQILPSQQVLGIPSIYPGGDPAIIAVPPVEQYRRDYVFLTPDLYAFDFVVITAPRGTNILLDDEPLSAFDCVESPGDGIERMPGDPPPDFVNWRCQLSFPEVGRLCDPETDPDCEDIGPGGGRTRENIRDGEQNDGTHTLIADQPVGIVVYGFDAFVSYAYAGGLNLVPIAR